MLIVENVGVYHDGGGVSEFHFNSLKSIRFDGHRHYYGVNGLDYFLTSKYQVKLAGFHVPYPAENSWLDRFNKVYPKVDHAFVFCSELHDATEKQLRSLDLPNVSIFICGFVAEPFKHARVYPWMDWFCQTIWFYKEKYPDFLDSKLNNNNAELKFDILLGCQRAHRDFIYNWLKNYNRIQDNYVRYIQHINQDLRNNSNFDIETEGVEFIQDHKLTHSIDQVMYYGERLSLSVIVPYSIYNQTNYSLVAETNFSNHYNFYTEKIVKPILAGRLFVVIAGQNYLKNLRSLGFLTFQDIINESYDSIKDNKARWDAALKQLDWLCFQDANYIKEKIKPIVEHNKKLLLSNDWYDNFSQQFTQELLYYLKPLNLREV